MKSLTDILAEMAEHDDVYLVVEQTEIDRAWRAVFRSPAYGPGPLHTFPLFDPIDGETELAAIGEDPVQALAALHKKIAPFFEPGK